MAKRIKKKEDTKSSYQDNVALIMGAFTLIVLCVLPLVFHDFYFDILETKYQFYSVVAIAALVIMGGYGLCDEYQVERMYRDAKLLTIGEGTSEICRMVVGRFVLKEY